MKIITALDNPKINEKLKKYKNIEIIYKDVQYREAIIEILERTKDIDLIIINEKIPGEITLINLINKIKIINKKVRIIIILEEKNIKKEKILKKNNVEDVYYEEELKNIKIIELINKNKRNNYKKNIKNKKIKIISFFGKKKLDILIQLIFYLINKNKKILLIDFNNNKIKNYIFLLITKNLEIKELKIDEGIGKKLNDLKVKYNKEYDYILVNTKTRVKEKINLEILKNSDKYVLAVEGNLLGIKEVETFIEKYKQNYSESKMSLHIIDNRNYFLVFNHKILKNILKSFKDTYRVKRRILYKNIIIKNDDNKLKKQNKNIEKIFHNII